MVVRFVFLRPGAVLAGCPVVINKFEIVVESVLGRQICKQIYGSSHIWLFDFRGAQKKPNGICLGLINARRFMGNRAAISCPRNWHPHGRATYNGKKPRS